MQRREKFDIKYHGREVVWLPVAVILGVSLFTTRRMTQHHWMTGTCGSARQQRPFLGPRLVVCRHQRYPVTRVPKASSAPPDER